MTTHEIASKLVELCRIGDFETAQKELYADDAISIEPWATEDFPKETKGLKNILEKGYKFHEMTETIHNVSVSDPIVAAGSFACSLRMDTTMKKGGRMDMNELCLYKVKDGKIISEEFVM